MKYIIVGLGNYGSILAEELTILGHDVMGIDRESSKVESIKDKIEATFVLDSTDEQSLSSLPIKSVDVVIVSIGESFGASIKTVALLKRLEAKHIYARASDSVHKSVLEAFNLDKILMPEKDAARSLVQLIDLRVNVESMQLDKEHYIIKFQVPKRLLKYKLVDVDLEKEFRLKVISLLKCTKRENSSGLPFSERMIVSDTTLDCILEQDDYIVCQGKYKDFLSFWKSI